MRLLQLIPYYLSGAPKALLQFKFNNAATAPLAATISELGDMVKRADTGNRGSISGGALQIAAGGSAGDPRYDFEPVGGTTWTRANGVMLIGKVAFSSSGDAYIGFEGGATGTIIDSSFYFNAATLKIYGGAVTVGTYAQDGTVYDVAVILRSGGAHFFIKGGAFTNWTLIGQNIANAVADLYAGIVSYVTTALSDMRVYQLPASKIPAPLISDNFSDTVAPFVSDGGGHVENDGRGSGFTWTGSTWTRASNRASNGATGGANVAVNPTFATDTDWTKGAGWTISAGAAHAAVSTTAVYQATMLTAYQGLFTRYTFTISNYSAGNLQIYAGGGGSLKTANGTYTGVIRVGTANGFGGVNATGSATADVDDVYFYPIPIADMLDLTDSGKTTHSVTANLTITADTPGGVCVACDSASSPQDFIICYFDRIDNKLKAAIYIAGAFVAEVISTAATYSAAAPLEAYWADPNADGTYDLRIIYNNTTSVSTTVDTATYPALLGNTVTGLFGLPEGGYAEKQRTYEVDRGNLLNAYLA